MCSGCVVKLQGYLLFCFVNVAESLKPCWKEAAWRLGWVEFLRNTFWQMLSLVTLCDWLRTSYKLTSWQDCDKEGWRSATVDCREMVSRESGLLFWWLLPKGEAPESLSAVESKAVRASQSWVSEEQPVPGTLPSLVVSIWLSATICHPSCLC